MYKYCVCLHLSAPRPHVIKFLLFLSQQTTGAGGFQNQQLFLSPLCLKYPASNGLRLAGPC